MFTIEHCGCMKFWTHWFFLCQTLLSLFVFKINFDIIYIFQIYNLFLKNKDSSHSPEILISSKSSSEEELKQKRKSSRSPWSCPVPPLNHIFLIFLHFIICICIPLTIVTIPRTRSLWTQLTQT
jgi:hypothetical protein